MKLRESAEMYLETILTLEKNGPVHSIDIAHAMNFSRPSVSVSIHNLEKQGFLKIDGDQHISLLPKGREVAERIYERHTVLSQVLEKLGVPPENAAEDACKIEHDISDITFECIKNHIQKFQ